MRHRTSATLPTLMLSLALLAQVGAMAVGCAKTPRPQKGQAAMNPGKCDRTVGPGEAAGLQAILDGLPEGGVLCLQPGRYPARLLLRRSVSLVGTGRPAEVVLDGERGGTLLVIDANKARIRLANLTLRGGSAQPALTAGAIYLRSTAQVDIEDVLLTENWSEIPGGQVLLANAGQVNLRRCRVVNNRGAASSTLVLVDFARVRISDSLIADNDGQRPMLQARDGTELHIERSTLSAGPGRTLLEVSGAPSGAPQVSIDASVVVGKGVALSAGRGGQIRVARSVVEGQAQGHADLGGNRFGAMRFVSPGQGQDPYAPAPGGPAQGLGGQSAQGLDLAGRPRRGSAGALEEP